MMRNIWSHDSLFYSIIDDDDNEMAPEDVVNELSKLRAKVAAAEKIFFHFGGLAELKNWENGQGETAADLIDDYLKL